MRRRFPAGVLAGRLLVVGGLFALAVIIEVRGPGPYSDRVLTALYALVLAGFGSTLAYALLARQEQIRWLEPVEAAGDLLLITALVYCTGGTHSIFGFLYVGWIVYVASRVGPAGALGAGGLSTLAYSATVIALARGWVSSLDQSSPGTLHAAIDSIGRHALAFLTTGLLCARLAREIRKGRIQLRELGEIYRKIVDNVSSGLLTVDAEERVTSFNREAERITGWPESEALGARLSDVLPNLSPWPSGFAGSEGWEEAGSGLGPSNRRSMRLTTRGGRDLQLGFSSSPLLSDRGEPEGHVLVFQDLSNVVAMEEKLRRSEKLAAIGQLAAGLAHEIRNPLASISGAIELLEGDLRPKGKSARRLFEIAKRETGRLNRLLSDFLAFARPKTPKTTELSLRPLLEEVQDLVDKGEATAVRIEVDVPEDLRVVGDPDQLLQVFWNLLLNAIQAQSEGGSVKIAAHKGSRPPDLPGPAVEISMEDRGNGIPLETLSQIFDPFFTTKPKGTGLGLATVHRIVEAHGGSIQITSEVGEGTCVRVFLPTGDGSDRCG
jgi:two-component system sensor histidine kinase PilS (NtrC family)